LAKKRIIIFGLLAALIAPTYGHDEPTAIVTAPPPLAPAPLVPTERARLAVEPIRWPEPSPEESERIAADPYYSMGQGQPAPKKRGRVPR
jgi:hypothetical protein